MNWCDNCGLCCMHMRTPPFLGGSDPEWLALPESLQTEITLAIYSPRADLMPREDLPCIWLDIATGRCRHYEHRPSVCRDYQVGGEACRDLRNQVGLTVKGMPVECPKCVDPRNTRKHVCEPTG